MEEAGKRLTESEAYIIRLEQVAEQALIALESCREGDYTTGHVIHPSFDEQAVAKAEAAIRAVLHQSDSVMDNVVLVVNDSSHFEVTAAATAVDEAISAFRT